MKVFCVCGLTKSGKTTTSVKIIEELIARGYSVGSVKDIHFEQFTLETEGTNTYKHKVAGAQPVTALSQKETDIMFEGSLKINKILQMYNTDYVLIEGGKSFDGIPKIFTAKTEEELNLIDNSAFAISGVISENVTTYNGVCVINALTNIKQLVDVIQQKVFDVLPLVDEKCCAICGGCKKMCADILSGNAKREDCKLSQKVNLFIDGKSIEMVDFVQNILKNAVVGVAKELDGYKPNCKIEVKIN